MKTTDLRLNQRVTLSGVVHALDITNGLDGDHPDFGVLPDGEALVTLHVTGLDESPKHAHRDSYAKVYSQALDAESKRPVAERTRFMHDVAADAVAAHAFLDIAHQIENDAVTPSLPLNRIQRDLVVGHIRDCAANVPGASSIAALHRARKDVVDQMTPAYAAWVTRNSTNVTRRLEDFVDEQTSQVLLAHFNISAKGD